MSNSFGHANARQLKKLEKIAAKIEALADRYSAMSDEELKACTSQFRVRLAGGETTDQILPEAFAVVREAAWRVLRMRHFHVQLLGGIALYQGRIAEMCTGEGKTLVATLPAYLLALEGRGVHIVTVNEYLATRDSEWMGQIYRYLGLTVGVICSGQSKVEKRRMYACDITYGTNNEFGFDYLRDNMARRAQDKVQRELRFAIVDEVDSVLIDEARTPLIISGQTNISNEEYVKANRFVRTLKAPEVREESGSILTEKMAAIERTLSAKSTNDSELSREERRKKYQEECNGDYEIDEKEKTIRLTDMGILKAEDFYGLEDLSSGENLQLQHIITQALTANFLKKRDVDYVVNDGEVIIVDEFTGRLMIGRRYGEGLHQAIEAKEGVGVRNESKTYATITFQNYFRLYRRLSGMTGTAKTEETEFQNIYGLDVICIPTNLPVRRRDENDRLYTTRAAKLRAIVEEVRACYAQGQPVLVGTVSVEKSEELSALLRKAGVPHSVLNAKHHEEEAEIVAQAGKVKKVTIATNMAGRGTDILLGGNPEFLTKRKLEMKGYPHDVLAEVTAFSAPSADPERFALIEKAKVDYAAAYPAIREETDKEKMQVIALGGLRIIGTERHESRRIDNQLRGRAGRQGDPGSSVFFLSLEDDLMRIFANDSVRGMIGRLGLPDDTPISVKMITNQIEKAQQKIEDRNYSIRKHVLAYDDVMNRQREVIYGEREKLLTGVDVHDQVQKLIPDVVAGVVQEIVDYRDDYKGWDYDAINSYLEARVVPEGSNVVNETLAAEMNIDVIIDAVVECALAAYEQKMETFNAKHQAILQEHPELVARQPELATFSFANIERDVMLRVVDSNWIDHIDNMDALRKGIGLRQYGQRDPVVSYQQEGYEMFEAMVETMQETMVRELLKLSLEPTVSQTQQPVKTKTRLQEYPDHLVTNEQGSAMRKSAKIGRNDPCPCGSGKKYKMCCGR
ncbi:MAG: preprotein translocase subunit SecA [Clostridia bacterium]|nr:preprotein translocase subunit SecA [Clostridia bacterium]